MATWSNQTGKAASPGDRLEVVAVDVSHLPLLEELYSYGGGDAFRQRSLELGVFYGVFDGERLVSVAGTHIVSDNERIAALGNVMTHPDLSWSRSGHPGDQRRVRRVARSRHRTDRAECEPLE